MHTLSQHHVQAADIAIAFLRRDVDRRRHIDHELDMNCLWAAIDPDGDNIFIGTPVLPESGGFYVDYLGDIEFPDAPDKWTLADFDDLLPQPDKVQ
jgi:hypothetical protein